MAEEKIETMAVKKMSSPYDLSASDNPGNVITQVQLKGENYEEWARAVKISLRARRKWGFIDGTHEEPEKDTSEIEDWWTIQSMLVSWILNTIEPSLRSTVAYMENAKDLWDDIKERFSIVNGPRIQQLKSELAECKQQGMTMVAYYGKLKTMWDELANYEQIPQCKCGGCKCNIATKLEKRREEEKIHQFLMGLDDENYGTTRSNVLATDPLPSLNRVYATMVQEERVRTITRSKEERGTIVGLAVRAETKNKLRNEAKEKSVVCAHCGRTGHDKGSCFEVIGYPDWWGERPRNENKSIGRNQPRTGSFRGKGGATRVNVAHTGASSNDSRSETRKPEVVGLSNEQWQILVAMLNSHKANETEKMTGKKTCELWIVDSGASNHMTGTLENLWESRALDGCPVGLPNGELVLANKEGSVFLDGGLKLENVLYVPKLNCNLISVSQLTDEAKCTVHFTDRFCAMQDHTSRTLIGAGERKDGLYWYRGVSGMKAYQVNAEDQLEIWHKRMGHPAYQIVEKILNVSNGHRNKNTNQTCEVCERSKQSRNKFSLSNFQASNIFDLIHCDLWGPYKTPSSCGASYFLTLVDDCSRAVWIYLLNNKKDVSQTLMNFIALIERQYEKQVKAIRSDNGTEFMCLQRYFQQHGILHQTSCTGTPQQNGRVERKHRHILNVARALRFQGQLPLRFWGECILIAGYLINRTPSTVLQEKTPYEILNGKPPTYEHLRVFGCLCYAHNQDRKGDKFASRSRKCVFVGYSAGQKGWKLFDLEREVFWISRDVKFVEHEFPFASLTHRGHLEVELPSVDVGIVEEALPELGTTNNDKHVVEIGENNSTTKDMPTTEFRGGHDEYHEQEPSSQAILPSEPTNSMTIEQEVNEMHTVPAPLGRGHRVRQPSVKLRDYVTNTTIQIGPSLRTPQSASSGVSYPLTNYLNCDKFSLHHRIFLAALHEEREPMHFSEAVRDVRWRDAMTSEIHALQSNGTWDITPLPAEKKPLGCKWIYKIKYHSDGSVERFKARLVVLGNHQVEGIDYDETFAPVAKMVTIHTVLAVSIAKDWELHQMDVHNAFLHGDLEEVVYMKLPPGFLVSQKGMVCRLRKSLYGLRQAPRCWFAKLSNALVQYGFQRSPSDHSLFIFRKGDVQLVVLVYVDDLVIAGNHSEAIAKFKDYLHQCFHMKDLGKLKYFLGVEVARSPTGLFLCQRKYALDIIAEAGLLGGKPVSTPIEENHRLALADGELLSDPSQYRRLVGRLIYLCFTRPELSYSVHILSQFMHQPREEHWRAALRVVRYLKGQPGQGVLLKRESDLRLYGWCDSDWASCPLTRRSLTGWFIFLGQSPISWKTKKQHTVSRSSAEAEYRSMANTTCELKWLQGLLSSLVIPHSEPMNLYCDNQAALHIAKNPVFHERTKHIEVDCHLVRDEIQHNRIQPVYVSTHHQLADLFTKSLGATQFGSFLSKLGIHNLHAPS